MSTVPKPKPGRVACCVPFCKRTAKANGDPRYEIICGKHWKPTNGTLRRRYRKLYRRFSKLIEIPEEHLSEEKRAEIALDAHRLDAMWAQLKKQAIEKAMGI